MSTKRQSPTEQPSPGESTRVKICGLTRGQDAQLAADLGAWALGFVFYAKSPRAVTPARARAIIEGLSRTPVLAGVFVNPDLELLRVAVAHARLTAVQLHGDETPDFCARVRAEFPDLRLIKALRVQSATEVRLAADFSACDNVLFDSFVAGQAGGTGRTFDWSLLRAGAALPKGLILSGGLTADNVGTAMAAARPFAVDVSSGVESEPGIKDHERMRRFFAAAGAGAE